ATGAVARGGDPWAASDRSPSADSLPGPPRAHHARPASARGVLPARRAPAPLRALLRRGDGDRAPGRARLHARSGRTGRDGGRAHGALGHAGGRAGALRDHPAPAARSARLPGPVPIPDRLMIPRRGPVVARREEKGPSRPSVLLIAMPWQWLSTPSIQLGLLQSVLERAGIRTEVRTLALDFMEHCQVATAELPEAERVGISDYAAVSTEYDGVGLGDWIFAIPPFRAASPADARYLAALRERGLPATAIAKSETMRRLVPAFLERMADEILAAGPRVVGFTTTFGQSVPSLVLARMLKQRDPSVSIAFGGTNCDGPMGAALHRAFPWVDVVVRGEAERVLVDLMQDLMAGRPVRPAMRSCIRSTST